jgi:hypothetical protein
LKTTHAKNVYYVPRSFGVRRGSSSADLPRIKNVTIGGVPRHRRIPEHAGNKRKRLHEIVLWGLIISKLLRHLNRDFRVDQGQLLMAAVPVANGIDD